MGVPLLGAVTDMARLEELTGSPKKRARHVLREIARTQAAADALRKGKSDVLGQLLTQSHISLSEDMEVSTPEVDRLAKIAQDTPGVSGARMMGGGFGGSVLALTGPEQADAALAHILETYGQSLGRQTAGFKVRAAAGAEILA